MAQHALSGFWDNYDVVIIAGSLRDAGGSAAVTGMPSETIERAVKAFEEGCTQVILSIAMLSRDYDNPAVRHVLDFAK